MSGSISKSFISIYRYIWGFPGGTSGKESICQCRLETQVQFLGQENPLEKETNRSGCGEQSGKSYRLVADWMWTSRQSSKLY